MMFSPIIKVSDATMYPLSLFDISATTTMSYTVIRGPFDWNDDAEDSRKRICMEMGKINTRIYYENLTRVMIRRSIGKARLHRPRNDGRNDRFGFKRRS